jgi:transcriptional regulator with XRE-family HTH domain
MGSDVEARLGRRVAELRKAAKLTQEQLAEKVGVAPETISRLERGASVPSLRSLERIAAAVGVQLRDMFEGGDARTQADKMRESLLLSLRSADVGVLSFVQRVADSAMEFANAVSLRRTKKR